jgi:hypothetical protein
VTGTDFERNRESRIRDVQILTSAAINIKEEKVPRQNIKDDLSKGKNRKMLVVSASLIISIQEEYVLIHPSSKTFF